MWDGSFWSPPSAAAAAITSRPTCTWQVKVCSDGVVSGSVTVMIVTVVEMLSAYEQDADGDNISQIS